MAHVRVTEAVVELDDGTVVARVEAVTIGGGVQVVTVDGVPEDRQHPTLRRWHVWLLSPDRMIPDRFAEAETYDEAVEVGQRYAKRRADHAQQVDALAADLYS